MNYVWDATEDNQPDNSKVIGQTDDFIVKAKQMTRERLAVEHNFDFTVNGEQGSHRAGSARVWVSETQPANPIPSQASETPGQLGVGRFWFKPSTGEAFVYTSTGWKGIGITGAQLLALLVSFAEKTSIATADKMLILDVAGGNVGKFVTFQTVLNTVLAERPWNDSAAVLKPSGVAAAGTSGAIARADHVHPKGDANTLDGLDSSYFQPASTAITTANIASQSVANADTVDGKHAADFASIGPYSLTEMSAIDQTTDSLSYQYLKEIRFPPFSGDVTISFEAYAQEGCNGFFRIYKEDYVIAGSEITSSTYTTFSYASTLSKGGHFTLAVRSTVSGYWVHVKNFKITGSNLMLLP